MFIHLSDRNEHNYMKFHGALKVEMFQILQNSTVLNILQKTDANILRFYTIYSSSVYSAEGPCPQPDQEN